MNVFELVCNLQHNLFPLFFQEGPIEIKRHLFLQGVLSKMAKLQITHKHTTHVKHSRKSEHNIHHKSSKTTA